MTARLPSQARKTRLTLSEGEVVSEDAWRDARTDALEERKRIILAGGYMPEQWRRPQMAVTRAEIPARIDWWRVLALLIVAASAAMTFLGLYLILVYVLTAF